MSSLLALILSAERGLFSTLRGGRLSRARFNTRFNNRQLVVRSPIRGFLKGVYCKFSGICVVQRLASNRIRIKDVIPLFPEGAVVWGIGRGARAGRRRIQVRWFKVVSF